MVWREKLGSDTEESVMHCPLQTGKSDKEKTWKTGMKKVLHMGWYIHDTHVAERFYLVHKEEAFRKRLN